MNRTHLLLAALTLTATAAQAQTMISPRAFPIVIDQPGHYKLSASLAVPAQTHGIKITASNVVLDLNGFEVKGPGFCGTYCPAAGLASGIWINAGNVTVRNGTVRGFDYAGVFFANFQTTLEDLNVSENFQAGIYRHSLPANLKTDTMPAVLRRVMAVRNGSHGVFGYGMTIENSSLSQNFGSGLFSQGYNNLFENVLSHNRGYGYSHVMGNAPPPFDAMRATVLQGNSNPTSQFMPQSMGGNVGNNTLF
ncbi:hypothetical protein [Roseateles sp. P5_E7]